MGNSELLGGLDDQENINDDKVYEMACAVCQEVLESGGSMKELIFSILQYLVLISARAKCFSYESIVIATNHTRKLLGLCYG